MKNLAQQMRFQKQYKIRQVHENFILFTIKDLNFLFERTKNGNYYLRQQNGMAIKTWQPYETVTLKDIDKILAPLKEGSNE